MNRKTQILAAAWGAVLWGGAGCAVLQPVEDPTRFYLLDAPPASREPDPTAIAVGLQPIVLPEYLKPRTLAVRRGPTEVAYADVHRWAEGFGDTVHRAIAGHLRASPDIRSLTPPPWKGRLSFDRVLHIRIDACEGWADGTVRLAATWRIYAGDGSGPVATGRGRWEDDWTPGAYDDLVMRLNDLVAQLCLRILADLEAAGS